MNEKNSTNNSQGICVLPFENKGFCVTLKADTTTKCDSDKVSDFLNLINEGELSWLDFVVEGDFKKNIIDIAKKLGFSELLIRSLIKEQRTAYEDLTTELGVLIPAIVVKGFKVKIEKLIILIKNNLIVTLHSTEVKRFFRLRRYAETLLRKLPKEALQQDKITLILVRLLDENNARNFKHLQEIEEKGAHLSKLLADPRIPRTMLSDEIPKMKYALSTYLGGLWATLDSLNSLRYGDADLLTDNEKLLEKMTMLVAEVNTQIGLAEHLSEVLSSGLEVLQTIYNNQLQMLNNRVTLLAAYLAIIGTALLVPNTIATILGGSMFEFSKNDVNWYIPLLIITTTIATILAWFVIKWLGFLPKREEVL